MAEPELGTELDELLQRGVWDQIELALDAEALASVIGNRSRYLNDQGWGPAFAFLQVALGNEVTLAVGRLFDTPKKFPTRSIPAVLDFIEAHAGQLRFVRREAAEAYLARSGGAEVDDLRELADRDLSLKLSKAFRDALPTESPGNELAQAYGKFLFRRDKEVAHSEQVDSESRLRPRWEDAGPIVEFAKTFLAVVGESYTTRTYFAQDGSFLFDRGSPRHLEKNLSWFFDEVPVLPNPDRA